MRPTKYILVLLSLVFSLTVHADTCSYKEQTILNNDFSNVKITYEVVNDNNINILIYNITENIYISYTNPDTNEESTIYYLDTNNGKYIISRNANNIEEYKFQLRSNISSCYGNILTTKNIIKPKYNEYSTLSICDNEKLINHSYCQKFITADIKKSESEVIKTLQEFIEVRVGKITTKQVVEEKGIDIKTVVTYSSVGLIVVVAIVILLLIKKKRGEL